MIQATAAAGGLAIAGGGASVVVRSWGKTAYDDAAEATWLPVRPSGGRAAMMIELVRCATLAANCHNTQPWRFMTGGDGIEVARDLSRHRPAVDPYDHHLSISLGCSVENIV